MDKLALLDTSACRCRSIPNKTRSFGTGRGFLVSPSPSFRAEDETAWSASLGSPADPSSCTRTLGPSETTNVWRRTTGWLTAGMQLVARCTSLPPVPRFPQLRFVAAPCKRHPVPRARLPSTPHEVRRSGSAVARCASGSDRPPAGRRLVVRADLVSLGGADDSAASGRATRNAPRCAEVMRIRSPS